MPLEPGRWWRASSTLLLGAAVLIGGCTDTVRRHDWSAYQGPGAAAFHREEVDFPDFPDPLEPANRLVDGANQVLAVGVVAPAARVYRWIVPRPVREAATNFAHNLLFPRRLVANLLQGKTRAAWNETERFAVNTTAGVGGLLDPATRWGIGASDEDIGQAFGAWGWRRSTYLMLPVYGPSTLRDTAGLVPDTALDPAAYFFPASPLLTFNEISDYVDPYLRFTESCYDPYQLIHIYSRLSRDAAVDDYRFEPSAGPPPQDTAQVQTLQSVFFQPHDPGFVASVATGFVRMAATGRRLPYTYRLQPGPAPIVFILPGLGGHRMSGNALALAEMVYRHGFSVALISNAMNTEFMAAAATVSVPGNAPSDAHDAHVALDAVFHALDDANPGRLGRRVLMGYSLGAFHTFYIAAENQKPGGDLVDFDRYVTLDAPVRLDYGLRRLDDFYNAPMVYPAAERRERVIGILRKALDLGRRRMEASRLTSLDVGDAGLNPVAELPLTNTEAEFLIGLAFRFQLEQLIYASQQREDLGVLRTPRRWLRREPAYDEIADYSFSEYLYAFVLPYYRDRLHTVPDAAALVAANDLRSIGPQLAAAAAAGKIRHFANTNDFLTTDADVDWLAGVLGKANVRFFPRGGHLGSLYKPEVQADIVRSIQDIAR